MPHYSSTLHSNLFQRGVVRHESKEYRTRNAIVSKEKKKAAGSAFTTRRLITRFFTENLSPDPSLTTSTIRVRKELKKSQHSEKIENETLQERQKDDDVVRDTQDILARELSRVADFQKEIR